MLGGEVGLLTGSAGASRTLMRDPEIRGGLRGRLGGIGLMC